LSKLRLRRRTKEGLIKVQTKRIAATGTRTYANCYRW
jgi:hypothetical protein